MANLPPQLELIVNSEITLLAGQLAGLKSLKVSVKPIDAMSRPGPFHSSPAFVIGPADDNALAYVFQRDESALFKVLGLIKYEDGISCMVLCDSKLSRVDYSDWKFYQIHQSGRTLPETDYHVVDVQALTLRLLAHAPA